MNNILITGASGFVGQSFFHKIKMINKYNIYPISYKNKKQDTLNFDLTNKKSFKKLPKKIFAIIHLAANSKTWLDFDQGKKQYQKNIIITKNLCEYAKKTKCKKFIFMSSVYVYSGNKNKFFKENDRLYPNDYLGKSKKKCEEIIKKFSTNNKYTSFDILRAFTIYGPNQRKNQFLSIVKKKIKSDSQKIILRDSRPKRDYVYIDDVIKIMIEILQKNKRYKFNIFNIASGKSYSVRSVVNTLIKISKTNKKVIYQTKSDKVIHKIDKDHYSDISKVKKKYGWKPEMKINKGLKLFYEF